MSTFLGGFVIAFIKGWFLTLVMLSSIPPLVVAGALMAFFMTSLAAECQAAYAKAAVVVEQTVGSIRTVSTFRFSLIRACSPQLIFSSVHFSSSQFS